VEAQFVERRPARGHRQHLGPDGPAATNVQRRVADDHNFFAAQLPFQHPAGAAARGVRDLVALFMIIRKRAQLEFPPQIEMAQLDLGAEPDVAGEQADQRRLRQGAQTVEHLRHARARPGLALGEEVVKPENIAFKEAAEVFRAGRNVVVEKKFADEVYIGAPGKLDPLNPVGEVEFRGEDAGKSLDASPARVNERAINVKEHQSHHALGNYWIGG